MPARGFQSTVSPVLHFGLGKEATVDSLKIIWLSGKVQVLTNVKANQLLTLNEKEATLVPKATTPVKPLFAEIASPVNYHHATNNINDFKRQPLLINPLSFSGPCMVKGDINGDGLEDVYAGGGSGEAGKLFIQQ